MADEATVLHDDAAQHEHNGEHGDVLVAEAVNPHAGRKLKPSPATSEMAVPARELSNDKPTYARVVK